MDSKRENELFANLCSSEEGLTNVEGQFFNSHDGPPMLAAIKMTFEPTAVLLAAQDDDSIQVLSDSSFPDRTNAEVRTILHTRPWKNASRRQLMWVWKMVNQQGYFDGIQFDFANSVDEDVSRIQLLVVASEFQVVVWTDGHG